MSVTAHRPQREEGTLLEANKELVRRLFHDIDALSPTLHEDFFDSSYVDHTPLPIPGLSSGIDGARQVYAVNQAAFSDPWHKIEGQVAEGDLVITWLTAGGRHTGELLGVAATDKDVSMRGVTIFGVVDSKIVSRWGISDLLDLFVQLGAVPPPRPLSRVARTPVGRPRGAVRVRATPGVFWPPEGDGATASLRQLAATRRLPSGTWPVQIRHWNRGCSGTTLDGSATQPAGSDTGSVGLGR